MMGRVVAPLKHARRRRARQLRVLLLGGCLCVPPQAWAAPHVPADDGVILEQVPGSRDMSSVALRRLNTALAQRRGDLGLAVTVARLDLEQSRKLGDPRFLGRAEAALAPWPVGAPGTPPDALLLYAVVQQSNHDFSGSLTTLARVVALKPDAVQAWLVRAAVHQAQADYGAAARDCGQVASGRLGLVPDTCIASVM